MKRLIKMPSYGKFDRVVVDIEKDVRFNGLDENGEATFNNKELPVVDVICSEKIHGCVIGETLLNVKGVGDVTIKEVIENHPNAEVLTMNLKTKQKEWNKIEDSWISDDESKQWYEVTLEDGRTITITGNHKVFVNDVDDYIKTEDLKVGMDLEIESHNSFECPFCKDKLTLINSHTKSSHLQKCEEWKIYKETILTKTYLVNEYLVKERSLNDIAKEHNLGSTTTLNKLCKKFDINTRNIKESKTKEHQREKTIKTNIKNNGYSHNFEKNSYSRNKWELKMKKELGVDNIFQSKDIVKKISAKKKNKKLIVPESDKTELYYKYMKEIRRLTDDNYEIYKDVINPKGLKIGLSDYHKDHKISKIFGWYNNIPPEIIAHPMNIKILFHIKNKEKQGNCSITLKKLLKNIKEFDNENN